MKAIIIPLVLFCNLCFGQKEFDADSCMLGITGSGTLITFSQQDIVRFDTIPAILLFIEKSKGNTSRGCRWVRGYEVVVSSTFSRVNACYLDYRKRRLPKNVVVFMSIN